MEELDPLKTASAFLEAAQVLKDETGSYPRDQRLGECVAQALGLTEGMHPYETVRRKCTEILEDERKTYH